MLADHLDEMRRTLHRVEPFTVSGTIQQVLGNVVRARVPSARIGDLCLLRCPEHGWQRQAEVIGLSGDHAILAPLGELTGISSRTEVIVTRERYAIPVGPALLGTVIDGFGQPFDSAHILRNPVMRQVDVAAPTPDQRSLISRRLTVGVRAIDALLTCAEGQRIGIFAAAGVGKTTLLSMIVNGNQADVCIIALIGERGREVGEFLAHELDSDRRKKTVVVVATADRPAMERLKAGFVATTIAEYFKAQGKSVLLMYFRKSHMRDILACHSTPLVRHYSYLPEDPVQPLLFRDNRIDLLSCKSLIYVHYQFVSSRRFIPFL
jgi:type III secretion protein N (ATPase)